VLLCPESVDDQRTEFVSMVICISTELVVTRYLLQVNDDNESVRLRWAPHEINCVDEIDVAALLRELFNWRVHATQEVAPKFRVDDGRLKAIDHVLHLLRSFS